MTTQPRAFHDELRAFEARRAELVKSGHERKWVVVHGRDVHGPFETADAAWRTGVDRFGVESFMLKRILQKDEPVVVPRVEPGF